MLYSVEKSSGFTGVSNGIMDMKALWRKKRDKGCTNVGHY